MNHGLTITPRHPLIGAEIRGLHLRRVDDRTFRRVYDAWLEHLVLVFPEQKITAEQQIAFARRFGDLEIHPSREHRSSRHPEIYRVSNVDERGNIMPQKSKGWLYMNLTWLWHTDSSFREVPSLGSILQGIEVPPAGGDTLFANMYAVHEALPDAERLALHRLDLELPARAGVYAVQALHDENGNSTSVALPSGCRTRAWASATMPDAVRAT
jgi:taurine dioxygenase